MQRSTLTALLAGAAVLAALVVPRLYDAPLSNTRLGPLPLRGLPELQGGEPEGADGALDLRAAFDRAAVAEGRSSTGYLVIEVRAPRASAGERVPVDLALVFDTSGSMIEDDRIEDARRAASAIAARLGPEDALALVTFDDQAWVRLPRRRASGLGDLEPILRGLSPGGGTNLHDGLARGIAELDGAEGRVRRVVLLSDGEANIGVTEPSRIVALAGEGTRRGVSVSALGVGLDFNEDLLAKLTDAGGGSWAFAESAGAVQTLLERELERATATVGREATLRVEPLDGVTLGEVHGWSGRTDGQAVEVFLGDLHAGETRKVVIDVAFGAPEGAEGDTLELARAWLRYHDLERGRAEERARAEVAVIADADQAAASAVPELRAEVARALAGEAMEEGARSWALGRREEARSQGIEALRAIDGLGAPAASVPELVTWMEAVEAPLDEADQKSAIKRAREAGRGIAR